MKGRKCSLRWNETNKCFQTLFKDWKPLIDDENVVFRVCNYGNVNEKIRRNG